MLQQNIHGTPQKQDYDAQCYGDIDAQYLGAKALEGRNEVVAGGIEDHRERKGEHQPAKQALVMVEPKFPTRAFAAGQIKILRKGKEHDIAECKARHAQLIDKTTV